MSDMCDLALTYASNNKPVFPCHPIKKSPLVEGGFYSATTDPEKLKKWWKKFPTAMVGMPTGDKTDVFVLDVDVREKYSGEQTLTELQIIHGKLPETRVAFTPNGGRHLYFQNDSSLSISEGKVGKGLDIRANGGYVIVPRSKLSSGLDYQWANKEPVAEAPEWLIRLAKKENKPKATHINGTPPSDRYTEKALDSAIATVMRAEEGTRNRTLYMESLGIFGLAKAGRINEGMVRSVLGSAASGCGLDTNEIEKTMDSAFDNALPRHEGMDNVVQKPVINDLPSSDTPITVHGKGTVRRISFTPADEIELKPIDWLVQNYIERHAITFLYGETEAFKTFICLDIACSIATGHDWLPDCGVEQGLVLYVCGEGKNGIRRRLEAWSRHHNKPVPSNMIVSDMSTDLADPQATQALVNAINETGKKPALVCVDTFARNYSGSENENVDIGKFYASVEANLVKPYDCSVIVTHHPGKDASKGARGGASIKQNADAMYVVKRDDSGKQMFTVMKSEKMKDAQRPKDVMFEAIEYKIGVIDSYGKESTSLAVDFVNDAGRQLIQEADMKDASTKAEDGRKQLLKEIYRNPTLTQMDYGAGLDMNGAMVSRYIKQLRKDRYLSGGVGKLKVSSKGKVWCGAL